MSTAARTRRDEVWEQKRNAYLQRQRLGGAPGALAPAPGYAPVSQQQYAQQGAPRSNDIFGEAIAPTFDPSRPQPRRATPQGVGESPVNGGAGHWQAGLPIPPGPAYPAPYAPAPVPYAPPQSQGYPQQGGYPHPQAHAPAMPQAPPPQQCRPSASQPWPAPQPNGGGFLDGLGQKAPAGRPRNQNFQYNQGNLNSRPW
eukprot:GGOE01045560.1.p2 GENE.GGOE01045560.1~~GGOE01045560.1.p2  ORF type:complete len:199 (+),score=18.31 GGOE01045560.1:76-672(+)